MKILELLVVLILIVFTASVGTDTRQVTIAVTNVSSIRLVGVELDLAGQRYRIGDLAPGESRGVAIMPTRRSRADLTSSNGMRLGISRDLQPGDVGRLAVEVTPTQIVSLQDLIHQPMR